MRALLGPIPRDKIILCSADASPSAQRDTAHSAGYFFPRAPWVGAVRNYAENLDCKFVILTTGHGLVGADDVISPYDVHITDHPTEVAERWQATIPAVLNRNRNGLMLFYAGGCPRDSYIELSKPILRSLGISLLSFGKPNMFDVDKIEGCVEMLAQGTSLAEIASILKHPDRLEFHFHL
jgi:hypothetical protein